MTEPTPTKNTLYTPVPITPDLQEYIDSPACIKQEYTGKIDGRPMLLIPVPSGLHHSTNFPAIVDLEAELCIPFVHWDYPVFLEAFRKWNDYGALIQNTFNPIGLYDLDATEFILSGNAWDEMFGDDPEYGDDIDDYLADIYEDGINEEE